MSAPLLYPVQVSAKVIRQETPVPTLNGPSFNREHKLEPGIHIHWALPDSLTRTKLAADRKNILIPGVPDLWLVVRFHPGASSAAPQAKRIWTAWVVDSFTQTFSTLDQWKPVSSRPEGQIHTLAGVVKMASQRSYGLLPSTTGFRPATAAYYPECRRRLGFHDNLAGIGNVPNGKLSYLVVGWFADSDHDPLYRRAPRRTLDIWKTHGVEMRTSSAKMLAAQVVSSPTAIAPLLNWNADLTVKSLAVPDIAAKLDAVARRALRTANVSEARTAVDKRARIYTGAAGRVVAATAVAASYAPRELICHGAVTDVPLAGGVASPNLPAGSVKLYPNTRRMTAALASNGTSTDQVNAMEMLLGDLDSQKSSIAGILDMPGAAHALTFQSVPGKAKAFARITVEDVPPMFRKASIFDIEQVASSKSQYLMDRDASGFWPDSPYRAAAAKKKTRTPVHIPRLPKPPTLAQIRTAFDGTVAGALAKGISLHPRLIQIDDTRKNAKSPAFGPTPDKSGSDSAASFLDLEDLASVNSFLAGLEGAKVVLPNVDNLYNLPGPRWYRPWAPQFALTGIGRSYKFGFDGRFDPRGRVKVRSGGDTLTAITVAKRNKVLATQLAQNAQKFRKDGIPVLVESLVNEMLLLDTESAGIMAALSGATGNDVATARTDFDRAIRALWFARDPDRINSVSGIVVSGNQPSPLAISPWQDKGDPIFADIDYTHLRSALADWELIQDAVDNTVKGPAGAAPPLEPGTGVRVMERTNLTASVTKVLASSLVTQMATDPRGILRRRQKLSDDLTASTFLEMDVLTAPLGKFDEELFDVHNLRLRAGAVKMNRIEVIDIFGVPRAWNAPADQPTPAANLNQPHWLMLPPRLPAWSRMNFRLQSSTNPDKEADAADPAVCGMLMPDFVEHSLEVFDADGNGVGQLVTDEPKANATAAMTLKIRFETHPWVNLPAGADPASAIGNPVLRSFVQSVAAQEFTIPANSNRKWTESGLSAMLRVIDTIRGTLDPAAQKKERKVTLLGDPIVVLSARLNLEEVSPSPATTQVLASNPPSSAPDAPEISVRIGDITRPDDGVLGCFIQGATPAAGRFAPVTKQAAKEALINPIIFGGNKQEADHPFVKDQECLFAIPSGQKLDIVILADIRGGLYATCGLLPRKKITIPREFIDAVVKKLRPSFFAGPLLTIQRLNKERVLIPPPEVQGFEADFVYRDSAAAGGQMGASEVPPAPPLGELPEGRVRLSEGWLRLRSSQK